MIYLDVDLFDVSYLEFTWHLESVGLYLLPNLGHFQSSFLFFFKLYFFKIYLFYFWLHWVFVVAHGVSLVVVSGGYSSLQCAGFSLQWLLLLRSMGSRHMSFSSCDMQAQ